MANKTVNKPASRTAAKAGTARDGSAAERRPSEQVLQVVDRAVGAVPVVADAVRSTVEEWRKPDRLNAELERAEARGADVRRQVTDQVVERARKARGRVEPVYRRRLEPVVRERVEPVYRERLEPAVRRVRERI